MLTELRFRCKFTANPFRARTGAGPLVYGRRVGHYFPFLRVKTMRGLLCCLGIAGLLLCAPKSWGCGDKLLILGRVLRYSAVTRPAAILAYASPDTVVSGLLNDPQWVAAVAKGKHRVVVVRSEEQVRAALISKHYDVVLISVKDARMLQPDMRSAMFSPVLLPVVQDNADDPVRPAEKEYGVALKRSSKAKGFLSSIRKALEVQQLRVEAAEQAKKSRKSL